MEPYNKLSNDYDQLYLKNITEFQKNYGNQNHEKFADFYPSFGVKHDEPLDFLIYGQAVYGWGSGFEATETVDEDKVRKSIEYSNEHEEGYGPLHWVNVLWSNKTYNDFHNGQTPKFYKSDYRTHRSFFWNVVYKLIGDFYGAGRESLEWSKKMVWSNLYKIARQRGNPSIDERSLQQAISCELVKMELDELRPKYCIVLTNLEWWKPFHEFLKPKTFKMNDAYTEIVGHELYDNHTEIVITSRPRVGDTDKLVKQILSLLQQENFTPFSGKTKI